MLPRWRIAFRRGSNRGNAPMPGIQRMLVLLLAVSLSGCVVASAVGTTVSVAGSVISTTAEVTGDVIGGAARTVTGGGDDEED